MQAPEQDFLKRAGRILNSGQSRSLVLTGNIYDLFRDDSSDGTEYVPLLNFLVAQWDLPNLFHTDHIAVWISSFIEIEFLDQGLC